MVFNDVCFSQCTGMAWDKDGDTLAVVNDKNGVVTEKNKWQTI